MKKTTYSCDICEKKELDISEVKGVVIHEEQCINLAYEIEDIEVADKHICNSCIGDICENVKQKQTDLIEK